MAFPFLLIEDKKLYLSLRLYICFGSDICNVDTNKIYAKFFDVKLKRFDKLMEDNVKKI